MYLVEIASTLRSSQCNWKAKGAEEVKVFGGGYSGEELRSLFTGLTLPCGYGKKLLGRYFVIMTVV